MQEHERPLMHDVAGYLCVTPPAATLLIDGLVKDGRFLVRSFDKKDRRLYGWRSPVGEAFLGRGIRNKMNKLKQLFAVLTPKERAALVALLEKVSKENS